MIYTPERNEWLWPLAEQTTWNGDWIWCDSSVSARNAYAQFRHTFDAATEGRIRFRLTADSFYQLFVDGRRVARGPSRGHLEWYPFDLFELSLDAGRHTLAVLCHHIGVINATVMTGRPGFLADIIWTGVDGETMDLSTGSSWKSEVPVAWRRELPCLMSHYGFWEECDLRVLPPDWTDPSFDDTGWGSSQVLDATQALPWKRLVERDIAMPELTRCPVQTTRASGFFTYGTVQPDTDLKRQSVAGGWLDDANTLEIPSKQAAMRIRSSHTEPRTPASITLQQGEGFWQTLDFGCTVSGYPELEIESDSGDIFVDLSYDDITCEDGSLNPERTYARMTDRYRLRPGINRIRPVNPRGFRYLMIDCFGEGAVRVHEISAENELYPFNQVARFECSDSELNRLIEPASLTLRICTTDAFTDCATRERVQWMQDSYLHGKVAAYAFGDTQLLRRVLFQGAQNALNDGRINGFMPSERTGCAFASSSLVWIHLLVDYWLFSGDRKDVENLVPTLRRLLAFIASRTNEDGLVANWPAGQFWDWAPIEDAGCLLLTNAFYLWSLERLSAHDIFRSALVPGMAELESLRQSAHQRFWQEERELYCDRAEIEPGEGLLFSQHANVLAVLAGICPVEKRVDLLRKVIDPANLGPVPVGEHAKWMKGRFASDQLVPVGTLWFAHFVCQALFECELTEEAIQQIHFHWGPFKAEPTFPETRIAEGNTTQCHPWAGGPAVLLPAYILGVRPTGPGWSRIEFAPQMGRMIQASGVIPTPQGPIKVACDRSDFQPSTKIDVPSGVEVTPPHLS